MGLDFIKKCAKTFQRSWDRNLVHLSEPNLYDRFPELKEQSYRGVSTNGFIFRVGAQVVLKLEGDTLRILDCHSPVGTIQDPPQLLREAITVGNGIALGIVQQILVGGRAADIIVS